MRTKHYTNENDGWSASYIGIAIVIFNVVREKYKKTVHNSYLVAVHISYFAAVAPVAAVATRDEDDS